MITVTADTFHEWRDASRRLLSIGANPEEVIWTGESSRSLFEVPTRPSPKAVDKLTVSKNFLELASAVACHDGGERWALLYRLLFRICNENRRLLEVESDRDVREARLMEKSVNRDIHKFHAFVRFRRVEAENDDLFVAWHEPQHFTVEKASPFFARRFGSMRFSILTPKGCAHWNRRELAFSDAATRDMAPGGDEVEDFWLLYYRSIFNPFRLNIDAMKKELPVRHWQTLPEAVLIKELVRSPTAARSSKSEKQ